MIRKCVIVAGIGGLVFSVGLWIFSLFTTVTFYADGYFQKDADWEEFEQWTLYTWVCARDGNLELIRNEAWTPTNEHYVVPLWLPTLLFVAIIVWAYVPWPKNLGIFSCVGFFLCLTAWALSYLTLVFYLDYQQQNLVELKQGRMVWWRSIDYHTLMAYDKENSTDDNDRRGVNLLWNRCWVLFGYEGLDTHWWPPASFIPATSLFGVQTMTLNMWVPTLASMLAAAYSYLPTHRRRRRKKMGLCLACGYSLKGLHEQRCPECGQAFENQMAEG